MSIAKLNKTRIFDVDFESLEWKKLDELYTADPDKRYFLTGAYINENGKFGARPYVSTDEYLINLPAHRLADIETVLTDDDIVNQIKEGKAGFTIITYDSKKFSKKCYDVMFFDYA